MPDPNSIESIARRSRVGVVVSRYNAGVTDRLLAGAAAVLERPAVVEAPGAFELPAIVSAMASCGRYEGVLALGCVIKGETEHDRFINHAVAEGLTSIAVASGVPVGFGVLTCSTLEQALLRARPEAEGGGDKGRESALALLATIEQLRRIASGVDRPGALLSLPYDPADKTEVAR